MATNEDDLKSVSRSVASESTGPGMSVVRFNAFDDLFVRASTLYFNSFISFFFQHYSDYSLDFIRSIKFILFHFVSLISFSDRNHVFRLYSGTFLG